MKVFFDTSALFKKYIQEQGSDKLDEILEKTTEITVAPTFIVEMHSGAQRRLHERIMTTQQMEFLKHEVKLDYVFFAKVYWNDILEEKALTLIHHYKLKTLDSIQLASALLAKTENFVTSDHQLFQAAKKEIKNAIII